jgi:hypothetical protein
LETNKDRNNIRYPKARLSPAKDELFVVEFARRHIESGDIGEILKALKPMAATRENVQLLEGRVTFYFSGWDEDPRETAEIPEIRAWFSKLTAEFPYWLHFLEKQGDSILHTMRLLCKGNYEKGPVEGMVGWSFDDLREFKTNILTLFGYMNEMYDRLGLPEGLNERVSEEVSQLIACSFD